MKTPVIVTSLSLQFDSDEEVTQEQVELYVSLINITLGDIHRDSQPQLVLNNNSETIQIDLNF